MIARPASLLAALVLLTSAPAVMAQSAEEAPQALVPTAITVPPRVLGDPAAPVTLDEYASFVCGECARWHTTVLPALRDLIDAGQVKVVFNDVVIQPSEHSMRTAAIGLCAAPGKFFDVAERFMDKYGEAARDEYPDWYKDAMAASGRTDDELDACMTSETTYNQIQIQHQTAVLLGITELPVIRINGHFVEDPTEEAIRAAILSAPPAPEAVSEPAQAPAAEPADAD